MNREDRDEVAGLVNAMLTVFQTLRLDDELRALVFVFAEDGAAIGCVGYPDEQEAFTAAMDAMLSHAAREMMREVAEGVQEARAQRPQG